MERRYRSGVLAVVAVAEMDRLRSRLGPLAEEVVNREFDRILTADGLEAEQHATRPGHGFWLFMPGASLSSARRRLRALSSRVVGTVLDIAGEQVRITPVIGYAALGWADTAEEFRDKAVLAQDDGFLHLDLVPVGFSPGMLTATAPIAARDRLLSMIERLRSPLQLVFTIALLLSLPVHHLRARLVRRIRSDQSDLSAHGRGPHGHRGRRCGSRASGRSAPSSVPGEPSATVPPATAIIAAYLPNEAATILDTVTNLLAVRTIQATLQVILAYNTPQHLPIEDTLARAGGPRSPATAAAGRAQHVEGSERQCCAGPRRRRVRRHIRRRPSSRRRVASLGRGGGSSNGHDIVQGHCVVRNGEASWVSRMVAVEFETIYAVSHPGRARLHGFGIFGGSNGYWRRDALRQIRMQRSMLTEDIDSSMRSLRTGSTSSPIPACSPPSWLRRRIKALWHQRMRWAQGWTQTSWRHFGPA